MELRNQFQVTNSATKFKLILIPLANVAWARICKRLRSPGIDSEELILPTYVARARIFKQSLGARNRAGIGLSYRPARLHRLAEFILWNQFLSYLNVYKYGLRLHWLVELVPWNRFLGSITWGTKTKTIFFLSKRIYSSLNYQRDEE